MNILTVAKLNIFWHILCNNRNMRLTLHTLYQRAYHMKSRLYIPVCSTFEGQYHSNEYTRPIHLLYIIYLIFFYNSSTQMFLQMFLPV